MKSMARGNPCVRLCRGAALGARSRRPQRAAQHPRHLGRRHRLLEHQRLQPGHDGLPRRPTSTASPGKARSSPTGTASRAAPPAAPRSSPGNRRSARACQGRLARREGGAAGARPTIAELLKPQGYATGQFGKNHLGDRDEHLPTVHGFDEFFGNPLPPQRRGGAGARGLPEGPRVQGASSARAASDCHAPHAGEPA